MLPDEANPDGYAAEESTYVTDLRAMFAGLSVSQESERAGFLEADNAILKTTVATCEAEIHRLESELAQAERDREQAAALVADPDETVVLRQDIRDILTVVALYTPVEFRPSVIVDRLAAAAGDQ